MLRCSTQRHWQLAAAGMASQHRIGRSAAGSSRLQINNRATLDDSERRRLRCLQLWYAAGGLIECPGQPRPSGWLLAACMICESNEKSSDSINR
jgi:hypothetical protein